MHRCPPAPPRTCEVLQTPELLSEQRVMLLEKRWRRTLFRMTYRSGVKKSVLEIRNAG